MNQPCRGRPCPSLILTSSRREVIGTIHRLLALRIIVVPFPPFKPSLQRPSPQLLGLPEVHALAESHTAERWEPDPAGVHLGPGGRAASHQRGQGKSRGSWPPERWSGEGALGTRGLGLNSSSATEILLAPGGPECLASLGLTCKVALSPGACPLGLWRSSHELMWATKTY